MVADILQPVVQLVLALLAVAVLFDLWRGLAK